MAKKIDAKVRKTSVPLREALDEIPEDRMNALVDAHIKEIERLKTTAPNFGAATTPDSIGSKTLLGYLVSSIDETGKIMHELFDGRSGELMDRVIHDQSMPKEAESPRRCIRCNTDYTSQSACRCGARASLRDNRKTL